VQFLRTGNPERKKKGKGRGVDPDKLKAKRGKKGEEDGLPLLLIT